MALIVRMRLLIFIGILTLANRSLAQNIGNWTLNNTLAGTGSAHSSAGNISAGPAIPTTAFNGGTEWYGQGGFPSGPNANPNAYLQFTVSPNTGYELNVASLVLRMRRSNTGNPMGSGPTLWSLRSSRDGYASDLATGTMTHNYSNYNVMLSGFSQLPTGVTFRLYGYGVTVSSGGSNRLVLDNVSITGSLFILPLHLDAPEANAEDKGNIALTWKAVDITGGTIFHLQRSTDGSSFETVHSITQSSDKASQQYSFTDRSVPSSLPTVYYRVQAIEPGGTEYLSRMISVTRKVTARLHIEKIAVRGSLLQAVVHIPARGNYTIALYSSSGALLQKQVVTYEAGVQSIPVSLQKISRGMFVLSVYDNSGVVSRPFVIQ